MPTRRTLLKTAAAAALSSWAQPVLAAPNRAVSPSNRSNPMTATLHYQNAELSYQLGGKADAPAIVLLHGGLGSAEDFAPLLPRLQAHFRTLAIDTRGHGRSTRGDVPLTYAQTADDARQIIEAVGLRQFHLFGFSDGGVTTYRIAAADARVQSVLTSAHMAQPRHPARNDGKPHRCRRTRADVRTGRRLPKHNPRPDLDALVADLRRLWTDDTAAGFPNENTANIKAPRAGGARRRRFPALRRSPERLAPGSARRASDERAVCRARSDKRTARYFVGGDESVLQAVRQPENEQSRSAFMPDTPDNQKRRASMPDLLKTAKRK